MRSRPSWNVVHKRNISLGDKVSPCQRGGGDIIDGAVSWPCPAVWPPHRGVRGPPTQTWPTTCLLHNKHTLSSHLARHSHGKRTFYYQGCVKKSSLLSVADCTTNNKQTGTRSGDISSTNRIICRKTSLLRKRTIFGNPSSKRFEFPII